MLKSLILLVMMFGVYAGSLFNLACPDLWRAQSVVARSAPSSSPGCLALVERTDCGFR